MHVVAGAWAEAGRALRLDGSLVEVVPLVLELVEGDLFVADGALEDDAGKDVDEGVDQGDGAERLADFAARLGPVDDLRPVAQLRRVERLQRPFEGGTQGAEVNHEVDRRGRRDLRVFDYVLLEMPDLRFYYLDERLQIVLQRRPAVYHLLVGAGVAEKVGDELLRGE